MTRSGPIAPFALVVISSSLRPGQWPAFFSALAATCWKTRSSISFVERPDAPMKTAARRSSTSHAAGDPCGAGTAAHDHFATLRTER